MVERAKVQFRLRDSLLAMGLFGASLGLGLALLRTVQPIFRQAVFNYGAICVVVLVGMGMGDVLSSWSSFTAKRRRPLLDDAGDFLANSVRPGAAKKIAGLLLVALLGLLAATLAAPFLPADSDTFPSRDETGGDAFSQN